MATNWSDIRRTCGDREIEHRDPANGRDLKEHSQRYGTQAHLRR